MENCCILLYRRIVVYYIEDYTVHCILYIIYCVNYIV